MAFDIGQGNFPLLNQSQTNPIMGGLANAIAMHLQMQQSQRNRATLPYAGQQAQANLQGTQLQNQAAQQQLPYVGAQAAADLQKQQLSNEWFAPEARAQIGLQSAQANQTQQSALGQAITNQFLPQQQQADVNLKGAQANLYNMGGPHAGVATQDYNNLTRQVALDNPQLAKDPVLLRDAVNAVQNGESQLPDGTPVNVTASTNGALNNYTKTQTTSGLIDQSVKANQAEKEIQVVNSLAQKDMAPYGSTIFNKSPQAFVDSFKSDDASQAKLGKFIAAQQAQFEINQMRTRLAGAPPGLGATQELLAKSKQDIDTNFPYLSQKARQVAATTMDDYLAQGLQARNQQGIGAAQVNVGKPSQSNTPTSSSQPIKLKWVNGQLVGA